MAATSRRSVLDVPLPRADVVAVLHRRDEHAPVADLARPCGLDDAGDHFLGHRVGYHDFNLDLRQEADVVFLAAIDRRVALLTAVSPDLGDGHAGNTQLLESVANVVHLVGSDDALDEFHGCASKACSSS